jgi:prolyl-tRNA synthetase
MKMSNAFGGTLHTAPGRSESEGHQLLQRAAMVRQVAQGIFAYLPLGWRTIRKIEDVMRSEMERSSTAPSTAPTTTSSGGAAYRSGRCSRTSA